MVTLQKSLVTKFILSRQRSDGAILYSGTKINPYFGHIAAIGLCKVGQVDAALRWAKWCFANWNWPDKYGLHGTMYDFMVQVDGSITRMTTMDSVDSYAALFLMLMQALWDSGHAATFVHSKSYEIDILGGVLKQSMDIDGLTWDLPDYHIKNLMDNCEVYAGLRSAAYLFEKVFNDSTKTAYYSVLEAQSLSGIMSMRMGSVMAVYKDANGKLQPPSINTWYPDIAVQFFPIYYDLELPFENDLLCNANHYLWQQIPVVQKFPWVIVAAAAQKKKDMERYEDYIQNLHMRPYFQKQQWPWFCAEAGWYLCL